MAHIAFCATTFIDSHEAIKAELQRGDTTKPLGPVRHMMAATEAGLITLILTNPIWVIKTRLCLQCDENVVTANISENKRYRYT